MLGWRNYLLLLVCHFGLFKILYKGIKNSQFVQYCGCRESLAYKHQQGLTLNRCNSLEMQHTFVLNKEILHSHRDGCLYSRIRTRHFDDRHQQKYYCTTTLKDDMQERHQVLQWDEVGELKANDSSNLWHETYETRHGEVTWGYTENIDILVIKRKCSNQVLPHHPRPRILASTAALDADTQTKK